MRISDWSSDVCSSDLARVLACLAVTTLGLAAIPGASAQQLARETLSPAPATASAADDYQLPSVLSDADIDRYPRIFDLQADGDWKDAARLIPQLPSKLLMGHVLPRSEERRVG